MGKFASSKTASAARKATATTKASPAAASAAAAKPSSVLTKRTAFKAKAKQPMKIPLHVVKKHQQAQAEPEAKPIAPFAQAAAAVVVDTKPAETKADNGAPAAERHITKKEKIQNRHDKLMRKFDVALEQRRSTAMKAKAARKQQRQQKQKVAQVVKGGVLSSADLSALKNALPTLDDALPSLNSLFQLRSASGAGALKSGVPRFDKMDKRAAARAAKAAAEGGTTTAAAEPRKLTKTTKTLNKKNEFMARYDFFQKLSADKAFKRNPREVIAAHIRNRAAAEAAETN